MRSLGVSYLNHADRSLKVNISNQPELEYLPRISIYQSFEGKLIISTLRFYHHLFCCQFTINKNSNLPT